MEFILGVWDCSIFQKSVHMIHQINRLKKTHIVASMEAEAFVSIQHPFVITLRN